MLPPEPAVKSLALSSLSVQPPSARRAAVVFERPGATPLPSKQFAVPPYPMKSTIVAPVGHEAMAIPLLTRATLPAVADMAIVPVASGVGSGTVEVMLAPSASFTR